MRLLGLLGSIPHVLILRAATYLLAFTLGASVGNYHATKAALQRELQASADRQRENHVQLIGWYAEKMKELRLARDRERLADGEAHKTYQAGMVAAARAKQAAERELGKQKETADGLRSVNAILAAEMQSVSGCALPGSVRRVLDQASGAVDPGDTSVLRVAETDSAGVLAGPAETGSDAPPRLTCDQLARGYVSTAAWGREGWALYYSWTEYWKALNDNAATETTGRTLLGEGR